MRKGLLSVVFIGVSVCSLTVGKSFAEVDAQGQDAGKVTTLKEILVRAKSEKNKAITGSKTATPLSDIPATINVVPRDVIEAQNATADLDKSIRNVSGVTQSSSSNYGFFNNYLIRGLNMNFLRDGAPDASTINGYARSLVDVEQVEVLKGPGSALYGSGAPGGSVNLVSKTPQENPGRTFAQLFGSFGTYQTSLDLTGPTWNENLLYRLNGNYYTSDGFRDLNSSRTEVLPTILWKANENHQVTFDFDYRKIDSVVDTYGTPFRGTSTTVPNSLLNVSRDNKYYTPFSDTSQEIFRGAINDEFNLTENLLLRNNLVILDRDLYLLRNAGGTIAAGSSVMTGRNLREQTDNVTDYTYQLEPVLDFNTGSIAHKLLTGFEVQYHDIKAVRSTASLSNITDVFNPVIPETSKSSLSFVPNFDRDIDAFYTSLYAQDQVELTEQWKVRFGGRTDWFDTKTNSHLDGVKQRRKDNDVSGQAGLVYQPLENTSFYAGISSSKQAVLSTESTSLNKPESADQIEIGNKTTLFNDKVNINLALFRVTRRDFLVTVGTETIPVGEQRTEGIDLDISSEPIKGWKLLANYSFQDAELLNVPQSGSNPKVDGNRPTGIPVNSSSFWTTYELQNGPLKGFGFGGGLTFKDDVFINQQNTSRIPSYLIGDLVFFYHKDWYEAQLNISNIGDTTYYRNGVNSGALPGDPLAFQGTVKVHF